MEVEQRATRMEQLKVPTEHTEYGNFNEGYLEMDEENDDVATNEYDEADDDEI